MAPSNAFEPRTSCITVVNAGAARDGQPHQANQGDGRGHDNGPNHHGLPTSSPVRDDPASPLSIWIIVHPKDIFSSLQDLPQNDAATVGQLVAVAEAFFAQSKAPQELAPVRFVRDQLINTEELADWIRESVSTIQQWRVSGKGPKFIRKPKHVVYLVGDVQDWLASQRVSSTTEADARRLRRLRR